jgi:ABC-type sugar transport system permease subunit
MTRKKYVAWIFLAPSLVFYLYFFIFPTINSVRLSFFEWSGFTEDMLFVGFKNFTSLLKDVNFYDSLKATFLLIIVGGIAIFILSFIFSFLLNSGIRGKKLYRNIIFFPFIVAPIIHSIYWGLVVYSPRTGILTGFFKFLNIEPIAFLSPQNIFWSSLFVVVWMSVGFYLVILIAAIERIPSYLYEAARIEGAKEFRQFFKITLPLIRPVLLIAIVLWVIYAIKMFDFFYAVGGVITPRELWTNAIYLYIVAFGKRPPIFELGYASAIGVFIVIFALVFSVIIVLSLRGEEYEY